MSDNDNVISMMEFLMDGKEIDPLTEFQYNLIIPIINTGREPSLELVALDRMTGMELKPVMSDGKMIGSVVTMIISDMPTRELSRKSITFKNCFYGVAFACQLKQRLLMSELNKQYPDQFCQNMTFPNRNF